MNAVDIIRRKRDGGPLSAAEIDAFVQGVVEGSWEKYQAAALLMAICCRGMPDEETARLTSAMVASGERLDWSDLPGPKVDKHSTGGVGDGTSLILAPLAAACGVVVPMMSGRGLGHTGGTLDKLEAIPGFRVHLDLGEFRAVLREVGCALVGQTREIAPADRELYALRDVTGTVESVPLITASILSKKIAEGIDGLVLDVKCGKGAFMPDWDQARKLARSLVRTAGLEGIRTQALVTAMDQPLGRAAGNALEVKECLAVLRGECPGELMDLSLTLAAEMLVLGGLEVEQSAAERRIRTALDSGLGLEKFRQIISRQGGEPRIVDDPSLLPQAPHTTVVRGQNGGFVAAVDAARVGRAAMLLGAGRKRVEDAVDHAVGVIVKARVGEAVRPGDVLAEVHYRSADLLGKALPLLQEAWMISETSPSPTPLLLERLGP